MSAIQPKLLTWARTTAGLSLESAAQALGLTSARGKTGVQRLENMELGEEEPSRSLIGKMAKVYRRPLLVFYLAEPPRRGDRGQDFRTFPGQDKFNPELDALVRDIKARQGLIRSMLEDDQAEPLDFIGSATMEMPVRPMAAQIAERLQFNLGRYRDAKNADEAFAYLRETIEASGVYVLLLGNLGSFHTNIPTDVFRGFALADKIAPLVVINDQDARTAWSFTAVHELAHLWLGQTGISGTDTENRVERYCNDVAGEFLLPAMELRQLAPSLRLSVATIAEEISTFAAAHRVSRPMVAYKLYRTDMIGKTTWAALDEHFKEQRQASKQREAERNKKAEGGPNYYVVRRHRIGGALLSLVRRSLDEGTITYTKAGRVLGVKPRNVEPLLSVRGAR
ncbi:MAG TPA: XRE family transcriptional regulator [Bryobacteraceae bacterium]|nr:XRE family transcriptional regulator [Bryobacteraceae bacterium]